MNEPRQRSWGSTSVSPSIVAATTTLQNFGLHLILEPPLRVSLDSSIHSGSLRELVWVFTPPCLIISPKLLHVDVNVMLATMFWSYSSSLLHVYFLCSCWLRGSWPRFRVNCTNQQIPTLLALSAIANREHTEVSPEAIWGDVGTKFLHPWDVWGVDLFQLWMASCRSLYALP